MRSPNVKPIFWGLNITERKPIPFSHTKTGRRIVTFNQVNELEQQLDEAKRTRGERIEDGTAQRDRPLHEISKENKDKKDAEFNERFKHRPPKALDEDETEFLDNLQTVDYFNIDNDV
ncbi:hypothetical protein CRYUN_Cryun01aG0202600 [Craigia yunnanensis]